jgi:HAD superfamily hydrolase (TIGR01509 family)
VNKPIGTDSGGGLAAVLFDMDGLLVSTEETWFAVETDLMRELGGSWGPEHQAALVGGPLAHSAQYMLDLAGRSDVDRAWVESALLDGMISRLREGPVTWMPGARELLEEVTSGGVPAALVSSSYRTVMDAVLDAVGREWFATTVSADDVPRTKPHADPYLAAAAALGVDPARCAALEDSATGAAAARAAGCVTVAVPSIIPVDPAVVDAVVSSLADIDLSWLRDLVARQPTRV